MAQISVRACVRCHSKKIKCNGTVNCQNCGIAGVQCEPYTRLRRGENLEAFKQARKRLKWFEDEVSSLLGVDCRLIKTGTSLKSLARNSYELSSEDVTRASTPQREEETNSVEAPSRSTHINTSDASVADNQGSEISVLALNATGEMRYLDTSSGSFFASYAIHLARSFGCNSDSNSRSNGISIGGTPGAQEQSLKDVHRLLSSSTVKLLVRSYEMWTQPLYPLIHPTDLQRLVTRYGDPRRLSEINRSTNSEYNNDVTIFYLVMALGAINLPNTIRELDQNSSHEFQIPSSSAKPSANLLFMKALSLLEHNAQHVKPSLAMIQTILLISIYGKYGPIGSSQWQLAGLAMRMAIEIGLHYSPRHWKVSAEEVDRSNRVFWTAYAIEITIGFNLGRPPSVSEDHVTANFPTLANDTALSIHHVKHRKIQSRMMSLVYRASNRNRTISSEERSQLLADLQLELDNWKAALPALCQQDKSSSYPLSYWERLYYGTTFVLHRSSPLCPQPSDQSVERCIRSAGAYIDNILAVLKKSNVPLAWVHIQGLLFASLTMLVTARTNVHTIVNQTGTEFVLIDFPAWTRNCSICLAIMGERWREDLLSKLDTQFEALANDTLKMLSRALTSQNTMLQTRQSPNSGTVSNPATQMNSGFAMNGGNFDTSLTRVEGFDSDRNASYMDANGSGDWEYLQSFGDFFGNDISENFWDIFPTDLDIGVKGSIATNENQMQYY